MKLFRTNQNAKFKEHLMELKSMPVMHYDKTRLKEKTTSVVIETTKSLKELDLNFLFQYRIFPEHIMAYLGEWSFENRNMQIGDTIVQQAYLPPIKLCSQKILFGVRIKALINEPTRKGFSYETLEGHVEKGISTFTIDEQQGQIRFIIHTFSTPGNFLTKLVGPIFSVLYQTYCTKAALKAVKKRLERNVNTHL